MKNIGWFSRFLNQQPTTAGLCRAGGVVAMAMLLATAGVSAAQGANSAVPAQETTTPITIPEGYASHHSMDVGGRVTNQVGSGAMYNTLVNLHSGFRVLSEAFEMHALPTKKNGLFDDMSAFGSGFGGDPNNMARLTASKAKIYEFSGMFRRDRQYFDYDLLGNPNITTGGYIPIGYSTTPASKLAWGTPSQSPVLFNTVRRMTDVDLTVLPFATVTYRFSYSHGTMEGPSLSPSYTIMKYDALLAQYQHHGSDDFMGALDWKPTSTTKISFEAMANHYRNDTFFTLAPGSFQAQEMDGTPVYLGNWDSQVPYGIGACNTTSMGSWYTSSSNYQILAPANTPGGLPIISPACAVVTSYMRTQKTRGWLPTETVRLQSSAIKNVLMNGSVHYTLGTADLPSYYENAQGLSGTARSLIWSGGNATVHRQVFGADYGFVWQATPTVSISDQADFTNTQQPGYSTVPAPAQLNTPSTAGNASIFYSGTLTPSAGTLPHGINGTKTFGYYGQAFLVNNLTVAWDATSRARFSLTYRYGNRKIGQGSPHKGDIVETDPVSGEVDIVQNGAIFNASLRPNSKWDLNGTVEVMYDDNALTPVAPRQSKLYRMHTLYRATSWATISGSYSDRERHNNTNNNEEDVASGATPWEGPINHVDFSRIGSIGAQLNPNEHVGFDLNYSYSRVYSATNICFNPGSTATLPGVATLTASGAPNICPGIFARGSTTQLTDFWGRDFEDAPTQFGSAAIAYSPNDKVKTNFGYRISAVNGSRFFNDARDVNGSLVSKYQSPFMNFAYSMRPGLIWKAEYNYFGYGEGGPSGAALCSTSISLTATVLPCTSFSQPTGRTLPASGLVPARVFHANNVTLGIHYEF